MTFWLTLVPNVPEYQRTNADDLDFFVDWYFDWDDVGVAERDWIRQWLHELPLGVVTPLKRHPGYSIVRLEQEDR